MLGMSLIGELGVGQASIFVAQLSSHLQLLMLSFDDLTWWGSGVIGTH